MRANRGASRSRRWTALRWAVAALMGRAARHRRLGPAAAAARNWAPAAPDFAAAAHCAVQPAAAGAPQSPALETEPSAAARHVPAAGSSEAGLAMPDAPA